VALATESHDARGEGRHGLIHGFGCLVRCWHRERNGQLGGVLIGEGHLPCRTIGQGDGIGELASSGRVEHGAYRGDVVPHPIGEVSAAGDRDSSLVV
jgi:hypothetical protein